MQVTDRMLKPGVADVLDTLKTRDDVCLISCGAGRRQIAALEVDLGRKSKQGAGPTEIQASDHREPLLETNGVYNCPTPTPTSRKLSPAPRRSQTSDQRW